MCVNLNFEIRTDLALESKILENETPSGVQQTVETVQNVKIIKTKISNEHGSKALGRPVGEYVALEHFQMLLPENADIVRPILVKELEKMIANKKSVLVVGLGNKNISPDALGPMVADKIIATRHFKGSLAKSLGLSGLSAVSVIAPGVLGQTGVEVFEIIKAISKEIKPDLILTVDALAAGSVQRLGTTIQITNTGISPGSGVQNKRAEISQKTLYIPVVAMGIPTVVDMETIIHEMCENSTPAPSSSMMVTPRDIDQIISRSSALMANAINQALFPNLSLEEIQALAE